MAGPLSPTQAATLATLRIPLDERPSVDPSIQDELQATLDVAAENAPPGTRLSKRNLQLLHQCEARHLAVDDFSWNAKLARGTLTHKAVQLTVGGRKAIAPARLVDLAIDRICEDNGSIANWLRSIDDGERAELRSLTTNSVLQFLEMFPPLGDGWLPVTEATTAAVLAGGRTVLRGQIDLKLGTANAADNRPGAVIIDLKTGSPTHHDVDDLRFYALCETLRTGVPPMLWANAYLDAGRLEREVVTDAVLRSAARRVVDALRKLGELRAGRPAGRTPGAACRFCPEALTCPVSSAVDDSRSNGAPIALDRGDATRTDDVVEPSLHQAAE